MVGDAAVDRRIATWLGGLLGELARDLRARGWPGRAELVAQLADDGVQGALQRVGPTGG